MKKTAKAKRTARPVKSTDIVVRLSRRELLNICDVLSGAIDGSISSPGLQATPRQILAAWKEQRAAFVENQVKWDAEHASPRWCSDRHAHVALRDQFDRDAATVEKLLALLPAKEGGRTS